MFEQYLCQPLGISLYFLSVYSQLLPHIRMRPHDGLVPTQSYRLYTTLYDLSKHVL